MKRVLIVIFVPLLYFACSWFIPWSDFVDRATISPSYLFDLTFVLAIFTIFKKSPWILEFKLAPFFIRTISIIFFALGAIFLLKSFDIQTPFKYVDHLFLQMLILAPLMEEAVFRGAIYEAHMKAEKRVMVVMGLSTLLFSFSHFSGLMNLPVEFHHFIFFQVIYTFPLGWICAKSRLKTGSFIEPVILHFIFNLVFYIAVESHGL